MSFYNPVVDTNLFQELQDMTTVLARQSNLTFEYQYGSFVDVKNKKVTASHFWDHYDNDIKKIGFKTDVILRVIGTICHTSLYEWKNVNKLISKSSVPLFFTQLFTLLEDLRLEENIRRNRLGTRKWFDLRKKIYRHYFATQLETNIMRNFNTDELFCMIYLTLTANTPFIDFPNANNKQKKMIEHIEPLLTETYDATSTKDIAMITEKIVNIVEENYTDSINSYFVAPINNDEFVNSEWIADDLMRADELSQNDREVLEDQNEIINEKFSTWHRENENKDRKQSFLRYELEHGTKTNLLGDGARDSEDGDQAMASVQGFSGMSKQNDYSKLESLDEKKNDYTSQTNRYGKANLYAVKRVVEPIKPTSEHKNMYQQYIKDVTPIIKKLKRTIEEQLEHKQNMSRDYLLFGRLSKKQLLPLVIDQNPRVFYKKDAHSNEIDATFTLLIDCSASMQNKMEQTKKAAIIFHEVLKQLKIPHSIVGFWEDGFESSSKEQPNYFHQVIPYERSLDFSVGPEILQLEAEDDNRDGFSIRIAQEYLKRRIEKHKFLLVFSDGEPSAFDYSENGIIDTHEAVLQTRKLGIDVIGVFLAEGNMTEEEEILMKNIYGRHHMLVPSISQLPYSFSYILKRLLLKTLK